MNISIRLLLLTFCCFFSFSHVKADSPLTSTTIYEAYDELLIIDAALDAKCKINKEIMFYLTGSQSIDSKMAVINALGWNLHGHNNAETFLDHLQKTKKYKNRADFIKRGTADELLCMSYILALDNYFDVREALEIAEIALSKNKKSYTFNIITALIKAQHVFNDDWCKVYQCTNDVRNNKKLKMDLKKEAINIIFDYMDLYKGECK
jgi:hypothetical protein